MLIMVPYGLGNPLGQLESAVPAASPPKAFWYPQPACWLGEVRSRKGLSKPCSEVMKTCLSYQHCLHHPIPVPMRKIHSALDWTSTYSRIPIPLHSWLQNTFAIFDNLFILTFSSLCFWFLRSDITHTKKADSFPYTPTKFFNSTDQPSSLGLWQLYRRQKQVSNVYSAPWNYLHYTCRTSHDTNSSGGSQTPTSSSTTCWQSKKCGLKGKDSSDKDRIWEKKKNKKLTTLKYERNKAEAPAPHLCTHHFL